MKRIFALFVLILIINGTFTGCSSKASVKEPDISQIRSICNLATLECYYHNVAKSHKESDSWMKKDRDFWIEYTGTAKIGIDMSKVSIEVNDDTVTVTLPPAKLLSTNILEKDLNENSYIHSADGLIKNKITADDQTAAINAAQNEMKKSVENNSSLLLNAQSRAQKLIENYIKKMGSFSGIDYKIKWIFLENN